MRAEFLEAVAAANATAADMAGMGAPFFADLLGEDDSATVVLKWEEDVRPDDQPSEPRLETNRQ
jgi:hypothetical protein